MTYVIEGADTLDLVREIVPPPPPAAGAGGGSVAPEASPFIYTPTLITPFTDLNIAIARPRDPGTPGEWPPTGGTPPATWRPRPDLPVGPSVQPPAEPMPFNLRYRTGGAGLLEPGGTEPDVEPEGYGFTRVLPEVSRAFADGVPGFRNRPGRRGVLDPRLRSWTTWPAWGTRRPVVQRFGSDLPQGSSGDVPWRIGLPAPPGYVVVAKGSRSEHLEPDPNFIPARLAAAQSRDVLAALDEGVCSTVVCKPGDVRGVTGGVASPQTPAEETTLGGLDQRGVKAGFQPPPLRTLIVVGLIVAAFALFARD